MIELLERFIFTTVGAFSLFYFFVKISLSYWKKRGILHEKPAFFWGNLKGVGGKRHLTAAIREVYEKFKTKAPFVGFYAYIRPMVLVLDLDLVQRILNDDAEYFRDRGLYNNSQEDPLSGNLLQLDGEKYDRLQRTTNCVFKREASDLMYSTLVHVAGVFERSLSQRQEEEQVLIIGELVENFNFDVISALAFGMETDSMRFKDTEFRLKTQDYMKSFSHAKSFLLWNYPDAARFLGIKNYDEATTEYFSKLIANKIKERDSTLEPRNTFLKLFADLKRRHIVDNKQITALCFSFISIGLEAYNSVLTFCLYELAHNREIQRRARTEIMSTLKKNDGKINANDLETMQYLKQILYETLRKYSPYPVLLRKTVKNYEVTNSVFMLLKENYLIIPIAAIHYDPKYFPQPEEFDPSRFEPNEIQQRHSASWLPFGSGNRGCIARHFAKLHMLMFLVTVLKDYVVSPCIDTPYPLEFDNTKFILAPKGNIKLRIERN